MIGFSATQEFEPFLKGLLMDVWQRLLVVGPARKFDTVRTHKTHYS